MKTIITIATLIVLLGAGSQVYAAKYKSAVSGRYVKSNYSASHAKTTYRTSR